MRQRKTPCCKVDMSETDVWGMLDKSGDSLGISCKTVPCFNCDKYLNVFLNIDSVEAEEDEEK